jgi:D-3-phosphoglycerate dehydrogenase
LLAALDDGRLRAAGLDTFEEEPLPEGHPLRARPQVVLTDHAGWYSDASLQELQHGAAIEAARVLRGEEPLHWVNRGSS